MSCISSRDTVMNLGKLTCPATPCSFLTCSADPYPYPHRDMSGCHAWASLISPRIQGKYLHFGEAGNGVGGVWISNKTPRARTMKPYSIAGKKACGITANNCRKTASLVSCELTADFYKLCDSPNNLELWVTKTFTCLGNEVHQAVAALPHHPLPTSLLPFPLRELGGPAIALEKVIDLWLAGT